MMHATPHIASICSFLAFPYIFLITLHQDIPAAEQASLNRVTLPELSPSDPNSNASSPLSSGPVTPVDLPPFTPDPLVDGKHQPDPRPFKPVTKTTTTPRGTVWRARQVLLNLGKRKRQPSEDTGTSTGVLIPAADNDVPLLLDSLSETDLFPSKVSPLPFVLVV
jgi:hypothetical protein